MAIKAAELQFRDDTGKVLVNGALGNLFGSADRNAGTGYKGLEVRNLNPDLTLSAVKAWLTVDVKGGLFAIAYDATSGVIPAADAWDAVDPTTLTYLSPTTLATGVTVGNLAPATKARIFCRRILSGATAATPESNRVWVGGTSPL